MATIDSGSTGERARRSINHNLPLVPFIDFLICLVVFLLANLGFMNLARLQGSALAPGSTTEAPPEAERKRLHVELQEKRFRVTWRRGATVETSDYVPAQVVIEGRAERRYPELARFLEESFRAHGTHRDRNDATLDEAVLHVQNSASYEDMIAVLDALGAPRRATPWAAQASVFSVSFAAD